MCWVCIYPNSPNCARHPCTTLSAADFPAVLTFTYPGSDPALFQTDAPEGVGLCSALHWVQTGAPAATQLCLCWMESCPQLCAAPLTGGGRHRVHFNLNLSTHVCTSQSNKRNALRILRVSLNRNHTAHVKSEAFISVWETHQTRSISIKEWSAFLLAARRCLTALLPTHSRKFKCWRCRKQVKTDGSQIHTWTALVSPITLLQLAYIRTEWILQIFPLVFNQLAITHIMDAERRALGPLRVYMRYIWALYVHRLQRCFPARQGSHVCQALNSLSLLDPIESYRPALGQLQSLSDS